MTLEAPHPDHWHSIWCPEKRAVEDAHQLGIFLRLHDTVDARDRHITAPPAPHRIEKDIARAVLIDHADAHAEDIAFFHLHRSARSVSHRLDEIHSRRFNARKRTRPPRPPEGAIAQANRRDDFSAAAMTTSEILGTSLVATSYAEFTAHCQQLARRGTFAVDLTNTHIVTLRKQDPAFREMTGRVDYFVPDSTPLVWCLNRKGAGMRDRVYGPAFMRYCIEHSPAPFTHYLLGGSPECVAKLRERFVAANPDIRIVGLRDGYFKAEDEHAILDEINRLSPDFVWVGLGTPKQQDWIHRHKLLIARGVIFADGFAFDVNAGLKKDAPQAMQRLGLTWLFRAASEPRRLVGRYFRYNSLFLYYLLKDALARRT